VDRLFIRALLESSVSCLVRCTRTRDSADLADRPGWTRPIGPPLSSIGFKSFLYRVNFGKNFSGFGIGGHYKAQSLKKYLNACWRAHRLGRHIFSGAWLQGSPQRLERFLGHLPFAGHYKGGAARPAGRLLMDGVQNEDCFPMDSSPLAEIATSTLLEGS
jgi:hypothetical protein